MIARGVAAFAALVVAGAAAAQAPPATQCRDDNGRDRCGEAAVAAMLATYGVAPAGRMAKDGALVMRAFLIDGYGRDAGLVSIVRPPAEEPRAEFYVTDRSGTPALSAVLPLAAWRRLVEAGRLFDRALAPPVPVAAGPGRVPPPPAMCLHSWVARVEAVDARGVVRHRTENGCDGGLAIAFAFDLAREAVAAMPACALLDAERTRNDVTRLSECTMLRGDRQAAAEALNAFNTTWFANPRGPDFARSLQYLFDDQAVLEWPGDAVVKGSQAASVAWATRAADSPFFPSRIVGESGDRVRIEGRILQGLRSGTGAKPVEHPMTMMWTRRGSAFRLASLAKTEPVSPSAAPRNP